MPWAGLNSFAGCRYCFFIDTVDEFTQKVITFLKEE